MNKKYIKALVLLGVTLSIGLPSCQLVNKYKAPEVDTEGLFRNENPTDTTSIANIPWKEYFRDPILQGLIDEGLNNNFDLQIAQARIKQAEASLTMARSAYFPSLALAGNVNQSRSSVNSAGEKNVLGLHSEQYTLGVVATWEADIWGKLNRQQRASYAQFKSTEEYRNLIQTSLIANIATSYYSLLALDEQLQITLKTIGLLEESCKTMQSLMDAGVLNGAAVEQSKALLYSTQVSVPNLMSNVQQLENSICTMLGRKPGAVFRSTFVAQNINVQMQHGIPAQMLAKRPDVRQAEMGFKSAFELTNAARASFYPSITLTSGTVGFATVNTLSQFFKPEHIFANIIGGISQPLFAKGQLIGQLKIRKAQQEEALLTFEKTVLEASQEVSTILYQYQQSLNKNENRAKQVKSLDNAVFFTQELLKAGEANYTEVLNAEQNSLQAQLGQVSDKLEQLQYSVNLYRSLGGGIE